MKQAARTIARDAVQTVGPLTQPLEVVQDDLLARLHRRQLAARVPQLARQPAHIAVAPA